MKRYIIITLALALGVISLHAQDTIRDYPTKYPDGLWRLTPDSVSHYRPHNDYSGLNSLLMRLANPFWDGKGYKMPDIGTGLRIEDGKIRPLTTRKESAERSLAVRSAGLHLLSARRYLRHGLTADPQCKRRCGPGHREKPARTDHRRRRLGDGIAGEERGPCEGPCGARGRPHGKAGFAA